MSSVAKYIAAMLLLLAVPAFMSGCSSSSPNSQATIDPDTGKHVSGWLPAGHMAAAQSDAGVCKACHGEDYLGGAVNVSCTSCHLGGINAVHPQGWVAPFIYARHASYALSNSTIACSSTYCHGPSLSGVAGSGPSCSSCHLGGSVSFHPQEWGDQASTQHAAYVDLNGNTGCANAACHGSGLTGVTGSGSSCSSCHLGGTGSIHPLDWGTSVDSVHKAFVSANGTTSCSNAACHGTDLAGVTNSGPSCSSCHLGGSGSVHPLDWGSSIDTLHGAYVDTNGYAGCANVSCHGADLSGVANSGPACSSCHIGGVGSFHPSNWGQSADTLHGSYVDTNGSTACANAACHGADLKGVVNSGPSCYSCHMGGASLVHPADWGNYVDTMHGAYVDTNGSAACANASCHGASLTGVTGSGPSCTSCHLGGLSSVHPLDWGASIDTVHSAYVDTAGNTACANAACHGTTLKGVTNSGTSCYDCHLGGPTSVHPQYWGANTDTEHSRFVDANGTTACANASCHGASLTGVTGSGPDCSSCHMGGTTSFHIQSWGTGTNVDIVHKAYVGTAGDTACANAACHGASLTGVTNSGPSCSSCHLGGATSEHPVTWSTDFALHGAYVDTAGNMACANISCHGANLTGVTNSGPDCSSCHIGGIGSFHPTNWAQSAKLNHGAYVQTNGTTACANAACHGTTLGGVTSSGPACSSCHANVSGSGAPTPSSGCSSCHSSPPSGASEPNVAGAHAAHDALTNVTGICNICHNGSGAGTTNHANGTIDLSITSAYNAKSGALVHNVDGTCSNVSCHGGQTTPIWIAGTIDVNTQCTSCHSLGTSQYNSFYSGQHDVHVNQYGFGCTECHDTTKLAVNHFTKLNTPAMEGPASATMLNSLNYDGSTCAPACHDRYNW